jgi:hypothetical protein
MKSWFQRERIPVLNGLTKTGEQTADSSDSRSAAARRDIVQVIMLFCCLEIVDALVTFWAVRAGMVWEGNSLVSPMAGSWGFVVIKAIGALLSGVIIKVIYNHFPKLSMAAAISIAVFYGAVLAWNSSMIIKIILSR